MITKLDLTDTTHVNTSAAASELDCSRQKILSLAARGLLTPVPVGGKVYFRLDEVRGLRTRLARARRGSER